MRLCQRNADLHWRARKDSDRHHFSPLLSNGCIRNLLLDLAIICRYPGEDRDASAKVRGSLSLIAGLLRGWGTLLDVNIDRAVLVKRGIQVRFDQCFIGAKGDKAQVRT
jgi:hypothetical protein